MEEARKTNLEIEYYSVIYDVLDKVEAELKQILSPTPDGEFVGAAVIKQVRRPPPERPSHLLLPAVSHVCECLRGRCLTCASVLACCRCSTSARWARWRAAR